MVDAPTAERPGCTYFHALRMETFTASGNRVSCGAIRLRSLRPTKLLNKAVDDEMEMTLPKGETRFFVVAVPYRPFWKIVIARHFEPGAGAVRDCSRLKLRCSASRRRDGRTNGNTNDD